MTLGSIGQKTQLPVGLSGSDVNFASATQQLSPCCIFDEETAATTFYLPNLNYRRLIFNTAFQISVRLKSFVFLLKVNNNMALGYCSAVVEHSDKMRMYVLTLQFSIDLVSRNFPQLLNREKNVRLYDGTV